MSNASPTITPTLPKMRERISLCIGMLAEQLKLPGRIPAADTVWHNVWRETDHDLPTGSTEGRARADRCGAGNDRGSGHTLSARGSNRRTAVSTAAPAAFRER